MAAKRIRGMVLALSLVASIGVGLPAAASASAATPAALDAPTVAPASFQKVCRKLLKEGSVRKCLSYEVTYGARCKKKEHRYMGKCWVDVYGKYTECLCYGPAMDGKWYWNAPE